MPSAVQPARELFNFDFDAQSIFGELHKMLRFGVRYAAVCRARFTHPLPFLQRVLLLFLYADHAQSSPEFALHDAFQLSAFLLREALREGGLGNDFKFRFTHARQKSPVANQIKAACAILTLFKDGMPKSLVLRARQQALCLRLRARRNLITHAGGLRQLLFFSCYAAPCLCLRLLPVRAKSMRRAWFRGRFCQSLRLPLSNSRGLFSRLLLRIDRPRLL